MLNLCGGVSDVGDRKQPLVFFLDIEFLGMSGFIDVEDCTHLFLVFVLDHARQLQNAQIQQGGNMKVIGGLDEI